MKSQRLPRGTVLVTSQDSKLKNSKKKTKKSSKLNPSYRHRAWLRALSRHPVPTHTHTHDAIAIKCIVFWRHSHVCRCPRLSAPCGGREESMPRVEALAMAFGQPPCEERSFAATKESLIVVIHHAYLPKYPGIYRHTLTLMLTLCTAYCTLICSTTASSRPGTAV